MEALKVYLDEELIHENLLILNSKILVADNNTPICILIHKGSVLFSSEFKEIAIEYLHAAYIGERLSKVAKQIELFDLPPHKSGNIEFTLIQPNKTDLIALFEEIIGYSDWDNDDDELDFMEQVENFIDFAENNTIRFPELFERYKEFSKKTEDYED